MKKIFFSLAIITLLSSPVFAEYPVNNEPRTWTKQEQRTQFSENYKTGIERLAFTINKIKDKYVNVEFIDTQISDKNETRYKIKLNSDIDWIDGSWIIDVVPYIPENMSLVTANSYNNEYKFWYVVYDYNMNPQGVAWARYGH